MSTQEE
jgi:hypothetical protein